MEQALAWHYRTEKREVYERRVFKTFDPWLRLIEQLPDFPGL